MTEVKEAVKEKGAAVADKVPISICIIAHNEEKNIADCLDSVVKQAAEVIVVNAGSTDRTGEILEKYYKDIKVLNYPNEINLNVNKMRAIEAATQPWIFYFDADERFTLPLWQEVSSVTRPETENIAVNGYRVGRKNYYFGHWLRYGGQYPDRQPRLFRRLKGRFAMRHIHEFLEIDGRVEDLKEPFIHFSYESVRHYFRKFEMYSDFQARKWAEAGVGWNLTNHLKYGLVRPFGRFVQKYFFCFGFMDGFLGLAIAFLQGVAEFVAYLRVQDYASRD